MTTLAKISLNEIRQRLQQHPAQSTSDVPYKNNKASLRKAAVLVPFVKIKGEWHLLFIQRAIHEKDRHSGQVAFAGGKYEESDSDLQATALREAHEEIGIAPKDVSIIGELNHHYSISDFQITPVVATVPWPYQLTLQTTEVAAAFTIPLDWLAQPSHHHIELLGFEHQLHGAIINQLMSQFNLRIIVCRLFHHLSPQLTALQYIGFIHRNQSILSF